MKIFFRLIKLCLVAGLAVFVLSGSTLPPADHTEQARAFTRQIEFDYVSWMINAMRIKFAQAALGNERLLPEQDRKNIVMEYLGIVNQIDRVESKLTVIFSNPQEKDPQTASADLRTELERLKSRRALLAPTAEAILQDQVSRMAAELGLAPGGQPIPPVLYHSTPLPYALIISPRDRIEQQDDLSLIPDLSIDQIVSIEEQVDQKLNVASLVVGIGGVGVYPTMVAETSDLNWLSEVVAHEWIHNYLTLRPLGMNYMTSPELRIMNETTAAIAGKEIGLAVLERYYPELVPQPAPPAPQPAAPSTSPAPQPPAFDFRAEMHITRLEVDRLLAEGKIDEAEAYMEARRVIFWEHGYLGLRKLNQAYFAFYGAYADQPGGAAGSDPVGTAVRRLRAESASLADFIRQIAGMSSFDQLQRKF